MAPQQILIVIDRGAGTIAFIAEWADARPCANFSPHAWMFEMLSLPNESYGDVVSLS